MFSTNKNLNGFTIVELTVALSVSAVVLVTGYELFTALRNTANKQEKSMAESWEAVDALEQIREDLLHAVAVSDSQQPVLAGSNPVFETEKFKLLEFYSLCVSGYRRNISGVRQINRIEYELVKEKDLMCLYRTAIPVLGKNKSSDGKSRKLMLNEIEAIDIFFHDGNKVQRSFSSKEHLPVFINLELTADGQRWPLAVQLPCGMRSTEQGL